MIQAFAPWHEFYALLGTASATMVALLFVAASIGSGFFSRSQSAGLRVFLSATVVHFGAILAVCLTVLAPISSAVLFGVIIVSCGCFGLLYCTVGVHGVVRQGINARIDHEDRLWYGLLPVIGYLGTTGSGIAVAMRLELACVSLALATALLLLVGMHNAWDITVWTITRSKE